MEVGVESIVVWDKMTEIDEVQFVIEKLICACVLWMRCCDIEVFLVDLS